MVPHRLLIYPLTPIHRGGTQLVVLLDTTHEGPEDVLRANRPKERTYAYDVAFGPESTQTEVYEQTTRALIDSVTAGYHATAFAYGPTGTHGSTRCM